MKFIRTQENAGNELVEYVRGLNDVEIQKDDVISFKAKAPKRVRFSIQYGAFIIEGKELCLVNNNLEWSYDERYGCEMLNEDVEMDYDFLFLDNTSINLAKLNFDNHETLSIELVGC